MARSSSTPHGLLITIIFCSTLILSINTSEGIVERPRSKPFDRPPLPLILPHEAAYQAISNPAPEFKPSSQVSPTATLLGTKPQGDPRLYQYAQLGNGLKVVNIYDPGTTQAAFAVAVTAGSFYDYNVSEATKHFFGLAHLTEHSLFLGTKHFPARSGFDRFLAAHGGSSNAYTAEETTVYFGDLSSQAFEEGLKRFSDFFGAPNLNADAIWGEVNAVNSEHSKNRQSLSWQMSRVMLSLANPDSPLQWFHTGDGKTLRQGGKEELVGAIRHYFDKNYCPPRMNVVTIGPDPLPIQLANVTAFFGDIPQKGAAGICDPSPHDFLNPKPFREPLLKQFLHVSGGWPQLWILFPLESLKPQHKSHPILYIKYLMSYGGKNSLRMILRDHLELAYGVMLWAEDTSAGTMVWLVTDLTYKGAQAPDTVLDTIFTYFEKARRSGIDTKIMQSLINVAKLQWDWAPLQQPMDAASHIVEEMTRLGPDDLLSGDSLLENPNPALILQVLKKLKPQNANICFIDPNATDSWNPDLKVNTLPFYGLKYTQEFLLKRFPNMKTWGHWASPASSKNVQLTLQSIDSGLTDRIGLLTYVPSSFSMQLPGPIEDIPTSLSLQFAKAVSGSTQLGQRWGLSPRKLEEEAGRQGELFFRQGWMLPRPRIFATFSFRKRSPGLKFSVPVEQAVALEVGSKILSEQMSEALENLARVGAQWSIVMWPEGLGLTVAAYESAKTNVVERVLAEFNKGIDTTNTKRCTRIVNEFLAGLEDSSSQSLRLASGEMDILLTPHAHSKIELWKASMAANLNCEVAADAVKKNREAAFHDTSLVMGACSEDDAKNLHNQVLSKLALDTSLPATGVERLQRVVDPGVPVELRRRNPRWGDKNHALLLQVLVGVASVKQRVLLGLVGTMLSQIIFAELRTKQQLGYIVGGDVAQRSNILTISCYVQGEVSQPDDTEAQCERVFRVSVPNALRNMTSAALEGQKTAFQASILQKPMSIDQEANHFESQVLLGSCFGLAEALLEALKEVTSPTQLLAAWEEVMSPKGSVSRKKVAIKYWGRGKRIPRAPTPNDVGVELRKLGLPEDAVNQNTRERNATLLLRRADSTSRAQILKNGGGLFPGDMLCNLKRKMSIKPPLRSPTAILKDPVSPVASVPSAGTAHAPPPVSETISQVAATQAQPPTQTALSVTNSLPAASPAHPVRSARFPPGAKTQGGQVPTADAPPTDAQPEQAQAAPLPSSVSRFPPMPPQAAMTPPPAAQLTSTNSQAASQAQGSNVKAAPLPPGANSIERGDISAGTGSSNTKSDPAQIMSSVQGATPSAGVKGDKVEATIRANVGGRTAGRVQSHTMDASGTTPSTALPEEELGGQIASLLATAAAAGSPDFQYEAFEGNLHVLQEDSFGFAESGGSHHALVRKEKRLREDQTLRPSL